jgi:hypothetical protein
MTIDRTLRQLAEELGFSPLKQTRHGMLFVHRPTGRYASIPQKANTRLGRCLHNVAADLRRIARSAREVA